METTHLIYESAARTRKALALIDASRTARNGAGFTADEVAAFTDDQWTLLEQIAGTHPASTTTRALVVSTMRNSERRHLTQTDVFAKLRGADPADSIFDGLAR